MIRGAETLTRPAGTPDEGMTAAERHAMVDADERHWWYRGRRLVLAAALERLALVRPSRILDAGCGSGRTLDDLVRYGEAWGVDVSAEAVAMARARGHTALQAAVEALPFEDDAFDLVTCLDVIEHTDDDGAALGELLRVTRPGGAAIVTVPAHPRLWSAHDEANLHRRRYTLASLRAAATRSGWRVAWDSWFHAAVLGPAVVVRRTRRPAAGGRSELGLTPRWADGPLEWPSRVEAAILRAGGRVPVGLSLLAVLTAPGAPTARNAIAIRPSPRTARPATRSAA